MKYTDCASGAAATADTATITITHVDGDPIGLKPGMTILVDDNAAASGNSNKAIITAVNYSVTGTTSTIDVAYYEAAGQAGAMASCTVFVYGSEFKKGSQGMEESVEPVDNIFSNSPIIIKEKYTASGSDMSQIGWVEVTTENGATGFMWYLKAELETRLRFDDYLETAMVEAVPAAAGSGAVAVTGRYGDKGMEGIFYQVENNGNTADGALTALTDIDSIVEVLDQQGAIEENVLFVNRTQSFAIDDMLAAQNSYGAGGTSYGLFDNDEQMALNLGFSGFRRGYDFYKSDWKYLNDATMRGGLTNDVINGLLVPAGSTNVYDQIFARSLSGFRG
jgi:hypothetical protein